ncbi:MAG: helix-turn-helix transcriptional regulator [Candidatus Magasanikbacteria bacterium]|nr:helix-turn-helix transcriptional regulator [Candidatus Magasanikbacteria bacterium]
MLEQLFGSKTRFRILRTFFAHPERSFFVRELSRAIDTQLNAVRRELELLVGIGLLKEGEGKKDFSQGSSLRRYYALDLQSLIYPEVQALITKLQILGQQEMIREIKEKGGEIKLLLLSGQFTNDREAPSDLLAVGKLKEKSIANIIAKYEKDLGFEVRFTLMTEAEFKERRQMMDKFIFALFEANNAKVVNELRV